MDLLIPIMGLLFTIALFIVLTKLLQKYTTVNANTKDSIQLHTIKYVDNNNKLVKITNNNTNYLILVGKNNHLLLDKYDETTE